MARYGYMLLDQLIRMSAARRCSWTASADLTRFLSTTRPPSPEPATRPPRQQRRKLLESLQAGDVVYAAALDRWCDNLRDFLEIGTFCSDRPAPTCASWLRTWTRAAPLAGRPSACCRDSNSSISGTSPAARKPASRQPEKTGGGSAARRLPFRPVSARSARNGRPAGSAGRRRRGAAACAVPASTRRRPSSVSSRAQKAKAAPSGK